MRVVVGGGMGVEYPRYAVEPRVALRLPPPRSAQRGEPFATRRVKEKDTTGGLVTRTFARAGTRTVSNKRAVGEPRGCLKSRGVNRRSRRSLASPVSRPNDAGFDEV